MKPYTIWHRISIILIVLSLLTITYTTILINNFKTPEATSDFLKNSNAYYYIAEIIKTNIRNRYPEQLTTNAIKLSAADALLNYIVSPNVIERIALPVLKLRKKVAQLPLSFVQNNLVINTQQYTQQLSSTLSSLQLPAVIADAANNVISSVPPQITIVDTNKNPNSVLITITKTRIFFENLQKALTFSWIVFLIFLAILLIVNVAIVQRLIWGFFLITIIVGTIGLIASFAIPALVSAMSSNPDPVAGVLKDQLWDGMVTYYFSLTRYVSLISLALAVGFYLLYRFVPFTKVQEWINNHILLSQPSPAQPTKSVKTSRKK